MTYRMYALYNKATELYEGIMLYRSDVQANRAYQAMLVASKGKVSADDFDIYCLGTFDNETAQVVYQGAALKVDFVPRFVPEEEKMSDERDENSVL